MQQRRTLAHSRWLIAPLFLFLFIGPIQAKDTNSAITKKPYYGSEFYESVNQGTKDQPLKDLIHQILKSAHIVEPDGFDQIVYHCPRSPSPKCYEHSYHSYEQTRRFLFGFLHIAKSQQGYAIDDVYCQKSFTAEDFPSDSRPAPGLIPHWQIINAEHTWPQSHFTDEFPEGLQKSDLHAIFPADSNTNTQRSNFEFAEVDEITHETCEGAKKGYAKEGGWQVYFEPPDSHKGNVARALFYFSLRYKTSISQFQEKFLRAWHKLDPVDEFERRRHHFIFTYQKIRNPFIDHPWLVEKIGDF